MKQIKTKSGDIICVEENPDSIIAIQLLLSYRDEEFKISKLSELTDKDCEEFVECKTESKWFKNYASSQLAGMKWFEFKSAKKSFISLLQLEGIDTSKEHLIMKIL